MANVSFHHRILALQTLINTLLCCVDEFLCQRILASTLAYTTYASCATYWTVILFVTSLYTW